MSVASSQLSGTDQQTTTRHAIQSLQLFSFRNYTHAQLDCEGASVILTGPNGAGKTNLLEALSLLTPGRGLRKAKLGEMAHARSDTPWAVAAEVMHHGEVIQLGTGIDPETTEREKRLVKIEGERAKSQRELARYVAMAWLTPQMDGLFLGSGSDRRRFIDRLVYAFDPQHASRVNEYEHVMRERNRLLGERRFDPTWVTVLEGRMAGQAVAIAVARVELIDRLNAAIMASETGFPKAHLVLDGMAELQVEQDMAAVDIEEAYSAMLAERRMADATAGRTTQGVHRTELEVTHVLKDMPAANCSTGEQKAMLLSILLAHARARTEWCGMAPIILLDEVVAHLDLARREELFHELDATGAQCFMTGTDAADFSAAPETYLRVKVKENSLFV